MSGGAVFRGFRRDGPASNQPGSRPRGLEPGPGAQLRGPVHFQNTSKNLRRNPLAYWAWPRSLSPWTLPAERLGQPCPDPLSTNPVLTRRPGWSAREDCRARSPLPPRECAWASGKADRCYIPGRVWHRRTHTRAALWRFVRLSRSSSAVQSMRPNRPKSFPIAPALDRRSAVAT
jgi:hypothetical protein